MGCDIAGWNRCDRGGVGGRILSEVKPELQKFIWSVATGAQFCQLKYGFLSSLTIAQAILESGWGKSELAQKANNLFGIKGEYRGQSMDVDSREYDKNGNEWIERSAFRKYPSWQDSIIDHAEFLMKPRYDAVRAARTPEEACEAIQAAGYATDPGYGAYLLRLIGQYRLDQYDVLTVCPYAVYLAERELGVARNADESIS